MPKQSRSFKRRPNLRVRAERDKLQLVEQERLRPEQVVTFLKDNNLRITRFDKPDYLECWLDVDSVNWIVASDRICTEMHFIVKLRRPHQTDGFLETWISPEVTRPLKRRVTYLDDPIFIEYASLLNRSNLRKKCRELCYRLVGFRDPQVGEIYISQLGYLHTAVSNLSDFSRFILEECYNLDKISISFSRYWPTYKNSRRLRA